MSKFKIVNLFDKVFISICVFLILYAWINFFIRNLWTTFILSLIFSSACVFLLFYVLNLKNEKKKTTKAYQKNLEEKFLAFQLMNKTEKLNLLKSIIEKQCECKKVKDNLFYTLNNKNCQIVIATHIEKISQFELVNLVSNLGKNVQILKIICCDYDTNLNTQILNNLEIEMVAKKKLYDDFFLHYNTYPICSDLNTEKSKFTLSKILKNFIVPNKAKSYFLCGLILIFSSLILPYHFYYIIFGSVLLLFSILCKLQPLFKH